MTYFTIDDPEEPLTRDEDLLIEEKIERKRIIKQELKSANPTVKQVSKGKKILYWLCGIESLLGQNKDDGTKKAYKIDTSIDQDPFWSNVCDANAVVAMALCGFVYAFFNKYD